ncbi:hypothetical protein FJT64_011748 [Amphibalanus amphitrite]|uniref:Uncharacterized protein n=1 Tax=Amphibalanus amphitrite TaxID=1232801 RepID=A0A6A4VHU6_AMPAM|nr:hypothetical protein FJT64_011748 [Amphibalanus amphitrite]
MSARSVVTAALSFALALGALGQRAAPEVTPRCSRPFAPPAPSCFCSTSSAGRLDGDVRLSRRYLPGRTGCGSDATAAAAGRPRRRRSPDRAARLSPRGASLCRAADRRRLPLLVHLTGGARHGAPGAAGSGRTAAGRERSGFSSVEAHLERVSVPRITGALFSQRLAVNATFDSVEIGEIAAGAFHQTLVAPEVRIIDSRVGRIARGAFSCRSARPQPTVHWPACVCMRSHVDEWSTGAHVGGVLVHVFDSHVAQLRRAALSTVGLVELRWTGSTVAEAEAEAVLQDSAPPSDLLPPADLTFINNTFRVGAGQQQHLTDCCTSPPAVPRRAPVYR